MNYFIYFTSIPGTFYKIHILNCSLLKKDREGYMSLFLRWFFFAGCEVTFNNEASLAEIIIIMTFFLLGLPWILWQGETFLEGNSRKVFCWLKTKRVLVET